MFDQKAASAAHYRANKSAYKARSLAKRAKLKALVDELKSDPCTDCGITYPPRVMDYHHVGDDKVAAVANLLRTNSERRIREEIAKCVLLCANCHRLRH